MKYLVVALFIAAVAEAKVVERYAVTLGEGSSTTLSIKTYKTKFGPYYKAEKLIHNKSLTASKISKADFTKKSLQLNSVADQLRQAQTDFTKACAERAFVNIRGHVHQYCLEHAKPQAKQALLDWWRAVDQF